VRRLLPLCILLSLGCSYVPTTRVEYDPIEASAASTQSPLSLAVVPFTEDRPPRYYPSYGSRVFLTYIPLIPWVKIPYERLDESHMKAQKKPEPWETTPDHFSRKLPAAIARDLERSNLFREVRFLQDSSEADDFDLVLNGKLRNTEFDVYVSSYMLGMPGVLLWLLPIPVGRNAASVEIELELTDRSGRRLWSEKAIGRAGKFFWLCNSQGEVSGEFGLDIYRYGRNSEGIDPDSLWAYHAAALRRAMGNVKESLRRSIAGHATAVTQP
jgi:hypothetical protein